MKSLVAIESGHKSVHLVLENYGELMAIGWALVVALPKHTDATDRSTAQAAIKLLYDTVARRTLESE